MLQKQKLRLLLAGGLFFISLGGWILHVRIHPPPEHVAYYVPFVAGLIGFSAVPARAGGGLHAVARPYRPLLRTARQAA